MRPIAVPLLLVSLGAAAAPAIDPPAAGPRLAIAVGAGVAFGTLGAHAEIGVGHLAAFLGVGVDAFSFTPAASLTAGARFFSGAGDGLVLSLNFATASDSRTGSPFTTESEKLDDRYLTWTLGWRYRHHTGFFGEAGAGAGIMWSLDRGNLGTGSGKWVRTAIPDVDLAFGFEF